MSETAGTIIKLLTAFTSPKACVKYISVALTLLISWKYFATVVGLSQIPDEQLAIVLLLIGVGFGSLVGHIVYSIFEFLRNQYLQRKQKKLSHKAAMEESELKKITRDREDKALLLRIQSSFSHLKFEQKATLRRLTLSNNTLDMSDLGNKALENNRYIQRLVQVHTSEYLMQINPVLIGYVSEQWAEEKESMVKDFLAYDSHAEQLLDLLDEEKQISEEVVDKEILNGLSQYSGCIRGMDDDRDGSFGYWLWFDDFLLDEFQKQTGRSYVDEVFISIQRVNDN